MNDLIGLHTVDLANLFARQRALGVTHLAEDKQFVVEHAHQEGQGQFAFVQARVDAHGRVPTLEGRHGWSDDPIKLVHVHGPIQCLLGLVEALVELCLGCVAIDRRMPFFQGTAKNKEIFAQFFQGTPARLQKLVKE